MGVEDGRIFKLAGSGLKLLFFKIHTAPEHQSDTVFQLAVAYHRIPFQKPHGMGMPDLAFCLWEMLINMLAQAVADLSVCVGLGVVVVLDIAAHHRSAIL